MAILECLLAYGTVTNGGGNTALTSGDSMVIKDAGVRGQCYLKAYALSGTAPLTGQLDGTSQTFKPKALDLAPLTTLAGDGIPYERLADPPLEPNDTLVPYAGA